jgi:hypothetical protein
MNILLKILENQILCHVQCKKLYDLYLDKEKTEWPTQENLT